MVCIESVVHVQKNTIAVAAAVRDKSMCGSFRYNDHRIVNGERTKEDDEKKLCEICVYNGTLEYRNMSRMAVIHTSPTCELDSVAFTIDGKAQAMAITTLIAGNSSIYF